MKRKFWKNSGFFNVKKKEKKKIQFGYFIKIPKNVLMAYFCQRERERERRKKEEGGDRVSKSASMKSSCLSLPFVSANSSDPD